uniref:Protein quiver n=1 Tax=Panagrolaimus sp. PS1159 TaxID=55785 RepID=A0AC35GQW9_9BILA
MSIFDTYHLPEDFPKWFQGCSFEMKEIYNVICDGYGQYRVGNEIGIAEWQGNLFCCSSNICNSANNQKIIVAVIFVIFVNTFVMFKQNL